MTEKDGGPVVSFGCENLECGNRFDVFALREEFDAPV
jgi:hypothetical protein